MKFEFNKWFQDILKLNNSITASRLHSRKMFRAISIIWVRYRECISRWAGIFIHFVKSGYERHTWSMEDARWCTLWTKTSLLTLSSHGHSIKNSTKTISAASVRFRPHSYETPGRLETHNSLNRISHITRLHRYVTNVMIKMLLKMIICANMCIIFEPSKIQNILRCFDWQINLREFSSVESLRLKKNTTYISTCDHFQELFYHD